VTDDATPWGTGLTVATFVALVTAGWRRTPVLRWFVLGLGVGVAGAWLALLALIFR
jgi:hypothetical protein